MKLSLLSILILLSSAALAADAPPTVIKGDLVIDKDKKTITIPAIIAPRKLAYLDQIYPVEVVACYPHPAGKKAHETVVNFSVKPSDVHKALISFGLTPGKPAMGEGEKASGPEVKIYLELPPKEEGGEPRKIPIEKSLVDKKTGKSMPTLHWIFTGSVMIQPDPNKDEKIYGADDKGTLIGIFPVTNETVIQTNLTMKDEPILKLETDKKTLPPEGTPVKIIIEAK
jgi:hypothetical protein